MNQSYAIFTLAIIVFTFYFSYRGFYEYGFQQRYLFTTSGIIGRREYYRLVTSGFLHLNWVHLLLNMMALSSFGDLLELRLGFLPYLLIYFSSIIGGGLLSLYLHRNHEYRALGASGGVFGIVFAAIFLFPSIELSLLFLPIFLPGWFVAIVLVGISIYGMYRQTDNIGHGAHLGGAIIGLLVTAVMYPRIVTESPWLFFGVVGISIGFLYYLVKTPLLMPVRNPLTGWRRINRSRNWKLWLKRLWPRRRRRNKVKLKCEDCRYCGILYENEVLCQYDQRVTFKNIESIEKCTDYEKEEL